jgi:hypothetical protein
MVLIVAHRKWFLTEGLRANVAMKKVVLTLDKIKQSMQELEVHRKRVMFLGYYLSQIADAAPDEGSQLTSQKILDTLRYGFNRARIRAAHRNSGLEKILKIQFKKF